MHGELLTSLEREGFALLPEAVPDADIEALLARLSTLSPGTEPRRRGGTRQLFEAVPEARQYARSGAMCAAAEAVLGPGCFAVRALLFDKTPEANWKVIWHQDLTIAVRERRSVEGFGPWSEKAGIPHVQPPIGWRAAEPQEPDGGDNGCHRRRDLRRTLWREWRVSVTRASCHARTYDTASELRSLAVMP